MKHKLTFTKSNKICFYDTDKDKNLSIVDVAFDNGILLKAGCRSGYCQTCQAELTAGEVEYSTQPPTGVKDGCVLTCITKPLSDCVINA